MEKYSVYASANFAHAKIVTKKKINNPINLLNVNSRVGKVLDCVVLKYSANDGFSKFFKTSSNDFLELKYLLFEYFKLFRS